MTRIIRLFEKPVKFPANSGIGWFHWWIWWHFERYRIASDVLIVQMVVLNGLKSMPQVALNGWHLNMDHLSKASKLFWRKYVNWERNIWVDWIDLCQHNWRKNKSVHLMTIHSITIVQPVIFAFTRERDQREMLGFFFFNGIMHLRSDSSSVVVEWENNIEH